MKEWSHGGQRDGQEGDMCQRQKREQWGGGCHSVSLVGQDKVLSGRAKMRHQTAWLP